MPQYTTEREIESLMIRYGIYGNNVGQYFPYDQYNPWKYNPQLYHYMAGTQTMTTIPGIPDGYELVRFDYVKRGDTYVNSDGHVVDNAACNTSGKYNILKKIIKLKAGKHYALANGEIVGPMQEVAGTALSYYYLSPTKYNLFWRPNGKCENGSSYNILKEVPAPATHRPFKDAKEFIKYANRWIYCKSTNGYGRAVVFDDNGIRLYKDGNIWTYAELANKDEFSFSDGTPVGIKL